MDDKYLAWACRMTYQYPGDERLSWSDQLHLGGLDMYFLRLKEVDVIVTEGTHDVLGWIKNFDAWAKSTPHPQLGPVHPGFLSGVMTAWLEYRKIAGRPVGLCGHSRGAAQNALLAGLMISEGLVPKFLVGFGEPRSGEQQLADLLAPIKYQRVYRNGDDKHHDLVTDVPYALPDLPYCRRVPFTQVSAPPRPTDPWSSIMGDPWGPFAYHHIQLYQQVVSTGEIPI